MNNCLHFQKEIPVSGHYELVVLGGGPAGVCAAIEAARNGAKVLLVESSGMLGCAAALARRKSPFIQLPPFASSCPLHTGQTRGKHINEQAQPQEHQSGAPE